MKNLTGNWEDLAEGQMPSKNIKGKKININIESSLEPSLEPPLDTVDTTTTTTTSDDIKHHESFETMGLDDKLLRGIYSYGFEKPSKIQQCSIPIIVDGKDIIAQSQSGTGKTGAFVTGALHNINTKLGYPQALIMVPTRELSMQINSVINNIGKYLKVKTVLCVGGTSVDSNIRDTKTSHVMVGTPGRIYDMIERKAFDPRKIVIFCMDEADELLKREFLIQTRKIVTRLNEKTQICAFSATLSKEALYVTRKFLNNPVNILIEEEKLSLDLIVQYYIDVGQDKYKLDVLEDLYGKFSIGQCIIYVNYKDKAEWLKEKLIDLGYAVDAIHSKLPPVERTQIMKDFRSGICRVLISTDLLARGIDVQQVGYVINYDLPNDAANYLHRIGRSGRYGKRGVAINFVTRRNMYILKSLMTKYNCKIEEMPDPSFVNEYLSSG